MYRFQFVTVPSARKAIKRPINPNFASPVQPSGVAPDSRNPHRGGRMLHRCILVHSINMQICRQRAPAELTRLVVLGLFRGECFQIKGKTDPLACGPGPFSMPVCNVGCVLWSYGKRMVLLLTAS